MKLLVNLCVLSAAIAAGGILQYASASAPSRHTTFVSRYNLATASPQQAHSRLCARTSEGNNILDMTSFARGNSLPGSPRFHKNQSPLKEVSQQGGVTLRGNVIYADSWDENYEYLEGVYSFPAQANTTLTPLHIDSELYANGGGVFDGNIFKYVSYYSSFGEIVYASYYEFDTNTGAYLKYEELMPAQYGIIANIVSVDPTTDRYYAIFPSETSSGTDFGYVDYSTLTKTIIAPADQYFIAMAVNNNGEIYAINEYGDFFKIDKNTGESEFIGETGVYPATFLQSMTFDPNTNRLYWASQLANGKAWLCEVDTKYGEITKISDFADNEEIVCLDVPRKIADDAAPAAVDNLQVATDKASTTVSIGFTMPTATYGGTPLEGELSYQVSANADILVEGKANTGESVSLSAVAPLGDVKFSVVAINDIGKGASESVKAWIGYDEPTAVSNVVFAVDDASNVSTITWEPSNGAVHNGYIEAITYDITRFPDEVVVASGLTETKWQESKPTGSIKTYSYEVVAVNGDQRSTPTRSNYIATGDSYTLPYLCTFDVEEDFMQYMVIDANNDERTWTYNAGYQVMAYTYNWENDADDWALTPEIKMNGNSLINIALKARSVSNSDTEKVSVWIGTGIEPSSYVCVIPTTELDGNDWHSLSGNFLIPADGVYRIGIKAESEAYKLQLQVDDINITENGNTSAPDEATNVIVTPASSGQLKATITFNAPATTIGGDELESLEKVVLYNGERVVDELPAAPGQSCYMVDREPVNGFNTYTIRAFNEAGAGKVVSVDVYVGIDIPQAPTDVRVTDNGDHTTITWQAPGQVGINGGYVNTSALSYSLYVITGEGYIQPVADNITDTTFDDYTQEFEGAQDMISYCVVAVNEGGESERGISDDVIIIGAAYTVPFFESFELGEFTYPLWWGTRLGESGFVKEVGSEDRDGGSAAWTPYSVDDECQLNTGKISLAGTEHPTLSFSCKCSSGADMRLEVEAAVNGMNDITLSSIDFSNSDGEWHRILVDLSELKDANYVVLKFHGITACEDKRMTIDRIRIHDLATANMAVELAPHGQAVCGEDATYRVKVLNYGQTPTDQYSVKLYADDHEVATAEGTTIGSMDEGWLELSFNAPIEGASMSLYAAVVSADDTYPADNRSNTVATTLVNAEVPAVMSLSGSVTDQGVELEWTIPEANNASKTDGFENYDPWATNSFGRWSTIDMNNSLTFAMQGIHFPLGGHAYAFTIFNPYELGLDPEYAPQLAPNDGKQFACAMAVYDTEESDKWLISPRLSGDSQVITLFASALSSAYPEAFGIYYSKAGNKLEDFNSIAFQEFSVEGEWKQYDIELPAGTTYFAIHYESYRGFGFFVDDVTYTPGYQLTGYNIYRNGELLTHVSADATAYVDTEHRDGNYTITACYVEGESALSEVYEAKDSGIRNADASTGYSVRGDVGAILFTSTSSHVVRISEVTGIIRFNDSINGTHKIALTQGVYVVTVDGNTHKVLVR